MDNQRKEQIPEGHGRIFDQLHPHPDVFDVVFVHPELPVVAHIYDAGRDKSVTDQQLFEMGDVALVFGAENFLSKCQDTVEDSAFVGGFQVVEQAEDVVEKAENLIARQFVLDVAQQVVEVAQQQFLLILQPFEVKQIDQVEELFVEPLEAVVELADVQRNLIEPRNGGQFFEGGGIFNRFYDVIEIGVAD